jgi:hypothetical protein
MPPTVDTTLPSREDDSSARYADDRGSSRSLDEVGAVAVLGAMVEQRKRASSVPALSELDDGDGDAIATQRRPRIDPQDDVFQKIR